MTRAKERPTEHPHIVRVDDILSGEPVIRGTRTPVRAIVELWRQGLRPEEIPEGLPHLTKAQVFDALSYFSDHMHEILEYIALNRTPREKIHPMFREDDSVHGKSFDLSRIECAAPTSSQAQPIP